MKKHKIIDNFLKKETYDYFSSFLKSEVVPWYYHPIDSTMGKTKNKNGFFSFCFYNNYKPDDKSFYEFMPHFIKGLNAKALIQIRANLNFRDKDTIESAFHIDNFCDTSTTGIFYMTTCNAKTVLKYPKNNIFIESVENRMLLFPTKIKHKAIYQTDVHKRYVINFNFFNNN